MRIVACSKGGHSVGWDLYVRDPKKEGFLGAETVVFSKIDTYGSVWNRAISVNLVVFSHHFNPVGWVERIPPNPEKS